MKNLFKILLGLILAFSIQSCTTVDSASIGIKFKKWSANEQEHGGVVGTVSGFVTYNPFTQSIHEYEMYIQRKEYSKIEMNAKDGAVFTITPILAYQLNRDKAIDVFIKYRRPLSDIEDGYIKTCIYDAYRTCGNAYTSDSIMANRQRFESEVRIMLEKSLSDEGFLVSEFTAQITPPPSLVRSIDAKNEAIQNALRAENQVKEAEANAKIAIAKAEGEAKALRIQGDGEAYYNRVVASSLSALLVNQYALEKWDGKLPTYAGGGNIPMINLK